MAVIAVVTCAGVALTSMSLAPGALNSTSGFVGATGGEANTVHSEDPFVELVPWAYLSLLPVLWGVAVPSGLLWTLSPPVEDHVAAPLMSRNPVAFVLVRTTV